MMKLIIMFIIPKTIAVKTVTTIVYLYTSFSLPLLPAAAAVNAVVVGLIAPATDAEIDCAAHINDGISPRETAAFS